MNANVMAVDTGLDMCFIDSDKYEKIFDENKGILNKYVNQVPKKQKKQKKIGIRLSNAPDRCIYYTADVVAEMLGISMSQAYKIIQKLNDELERKGYIVTAGRVSKKYLQEKYYELEEMENMFGNTKGK